ncbi:MAG: carboxypeptidase-like regulatory domain-containing protein [Leadbetterella sp.]|nr:carboxypeptidase-like regulatory domain-containing protein [Leadbetterella sp.]
MKFKHFLAILLSVGLQVFALAQNPGRITGSVGDENGKLPGATVSIPSVKIFSASDLDGNFSIGNIPPGSYTLVISFVGYNNLEKEFLIGSGESLDLGLLAFSSSSNTLLDAVVVRGSMAPSQAKAYSIQRNAPGIMNVIASDNIGKLPDRNAAEAVQRMPGVSIERDHGEGRYVSVRGTPLQWNSTLINGNRMPTSEGTSDNSSGTRTSPLDIFPSEMIEYVQLSKAITPDMEGDAIGGSVNFITRTAPKKTDAENCRWRRV